MFSKLPDRINNPPPDRLSSPVARLSKLFRPYRTFYVSLIAVAVQHQAGDAPDVDLGDHALESYGSNLYPRLKHKEAESREIRSLRDRRPRPHIGAMQHLDLSEEEAAALVALLTCTIECDHVPLSPRIRSSKDVLAKLRPEPVREPLPPP